MTGKSSILFTYFLSGKNNSWFNNKINMKTNIDNMIYWWWHDHDAEAKYMMKCFQWNVSNKSIQDHNEFEYQSIINEINIIFVLIWLSHKYS